MNYIETERLLLRDWLEEDLPFFVEMNQDPRVMEYFPEPLMESETLAFYERIRKEFAECGYGLYAAEAKNSGEFIGFIGLHQATFTSGFTPCLEIGWRLRYAAWGQGYATEGARACLENAFGQLRLSEVYSFTAKSNWRSEHVMQKIGMHKLGNFEHPLLPSGHPLRDHVLYRMRSTEYNPGR